MEFSIRPMDATSRQEFESVALPLLDYLYGAAMRMTRDRAEAEDLVQDTMIRAYRFWSKFEPGTNIKAWLLTILRNTFITGVNKRNRARQFKQELGQQAESMGMEGTLPHTNPSTIAPDEALAQTTERQQILEALDSLPEDYRTAVSLADLQGLSYREIADIVECPIGTVMSRLYRGRKILHKLLFDHAVKSGRIASDHPPQQDFAKDKSTVSMSEFRKRRQQV